MTFQEVLAQVIAWRRREHGAIVGPSNHSESSAADTRLPTTGAASLGKVQEHCFSPSDDLL